MKKGERRAPHMHVPHARVWELKGRNDILNHMERILGVGEGRKSLMNSRNYLCSSLILSQSICMNVLINYKYKCFIILTKLLTI